MLSVMEDKKANISALKNFIRLFIYAGFTRLRLAQPQTKRMVKPSQIALATGQ
jgi:hypothetical protein